MAINIDIAANTRDFQAGVKDVDSALDKVADSLDDVARDGEKSTEKLEDSFKDLARSADREMDKVGRSAETNIKGKGGEAARGFKEEALQNFSETASSFDGSAQDIADGIQGTFGGLASSLPLPLGIAAGAIGLIGGAIAQGWADNTEAMNEASAEWAQSYIDAGGRVLSASDQVSKAQAIFTDPEKYKQATENAKNWGVSTSTAVAAMTGETWALSAAQDGLKKKTAELDDEQVKNQGRTVESREKMATWNDQIRNGTGALDTLTGSMAKGAAQADSYSQYLVEMAEHTEGATTAIDEFGDKIVTLPDGKQIYIDAETGKATEDTDAIKNKIYGIADKTVTIDANTDPARAAFDRLIDGYQNKTVTLRAIMNASDSLGRQIIP